jgi:flagellar basal-body rod protein FlgC
MKPLPPHLVEADTVTTAYSGMRAQRIRMNAIANNIANVHTTRGPNGEFAPFLRKEVVFKTLGIKPNAPYNQGVEVQSIVDAPRALQKIYEPDHPESDENGYRVTPNVKIPLEMANMIEASRAYEANLRAMKVSGRAFKQDVDILAPAKR